MVKDKVPSFFHSLKKAIECANQTKIRMTCGSGAHASESTKMKV